MACSFFLSSLGTAPAVWDPPGERQQVPQPLLGHILHQLGLQRPFLIILSCDQSPASPNLNFGARGNCPNVLEDSSQLASPSTTLPGLLETPNLLHGHHAAQPEFILPVLLIVNLIIFVYNKFHSCFTYFYL